MSPAETPWTRKTAIEDEGFTATFDPDEPGDAECTVEDQDLVGEAEQGEDVTLTITCAVPDVTGEDGQIAVDNLEAVRFAWAVDDCDDDLAGCAVADQDFFEADSGAEISLTMESSDDYGDPSVGDYDPVSSSDVEGRDTNAAQYARGELDECLDDAGPFCEER